NRVDKKNTARAVASDKASPLADYYKALIGAEFQLAIPPDPRGVKIEGLDQFFRKLAPQYASLRAQSFADYKQMLAVWLMAVPEQSVQVGDTWTPKSKFSVTGQEVDATYRDTYAGHEGPLDKITVSTQLQYHIGDADKPKGFPVPINRIDLKTSEGTGVILFDRAKGRIVRSEMTLDLEGPMTMILADKEARVILKQ